MPSPPKIPSLTISPPSTPSETPKRTDSNQPPSTAQPDEKPKSAGAKRSVESTAAYRFLLQFQRNTAPPLYPQTIIRDDTDADSTTDENNSITTNATSPTLTSISTSFPTGFTDGKPSERDDVSSLPSLSTSAATETDDGTPEMKYSVPATTMRKGGQDGVVESIIYDSSSA
ncbi:hypothetical protein PRK78_003255 [Emydomyces testavorans]|uniref:Uncharacterized protein n=1 Tax=Emydomyces testavorans TaxID=2070801 RepID=A0AAF0DGG6_9EURO|nr:hypothetical protein PRK78_003255 [Emydomyces testavorans]